MVRAKGKRTTVSLDDVYAALHELGFEEMEPQLARALEAYRGHVQARKGPRAADDDAAAPSKDNDEGRDDVTGSPVIVLRESDQPQPQPQPPSAPPPAA